MVLRVPEPESGRQEAAPTRARQHSQLSGTARRALLVHTRADQPNRPQRRLAGRRAELITGTQPSGRADTPPDSGTWSPCGAGLSRVTGQTAPAGETAL